MNFKHNEFIFIYVIFLQGFTYKITKKKNINFYMSNKLKSQYKKKYIMLDVLTLTKLQNYN